MLISCCKYSAACLPGGGGASTFSRAVQERREGRAGSQGLGGLGLAAVVPHSLQLTLHEKRNMHSEAGPALQAGGQLGEVVAVEVEDHLQCLLAALYVVEDVGVFRGLRAPIPSTTAALDLPSPGARVAP